MSKMWTPYRLAGSIDTNDQSQGSLKPETHLVLVVKGADSTKIVRQLRTEEIVEDVDRTPGYSSL